MGLRWTLRRLWQILRAVCTFAAHAAAIPYPDVAVHPHSSGSQGVILAQRQMKSPRRASLLLTLLQSFPDQDESVPWPLEHPRFQAETGLMPVLRCGSCPFNACEQLICLSLSQFFPSFLRIPSLPSLSCHPSPQPR